MLKLVWELLKNDFAPTGNPLNDIIIGAFIFTVLNQFAYKTVGDLYRVGIINGRLAGSLLNFSIKIGLLLVTMAMMWVFKSLTAIIHVWL